MTLSIVARDPAEGVVGAAVTSCALAAGRRILHVRPGVGAAVAQASSEIRWGDDLLGLLASGSTAAEAVQRFAFDETQIAAIGFDGAPAVHSGVGCTNYVQDRLAADVSCQVNTAALPDAADRMSDAFANAEGPLAERMVAALAASGGDARGQQGAAVVVTSDRPLGGYADEPHVDLRVDDHRDPVAELARLLALHRAHCTMRLLEDHPANDRIAVLLRLLDSHAGDPHLERAVGRARDQMMDTH